MPLTATATTMPQRTALASSRRPLLRRYARLMATIRKASSPSRRVMTNACNMTLGTLSLNETESQNPKVSLLPLNPTGQVSIPDCDKLGQMRTRTHLFLLIVASLGLTALWTLALSAQQPTFRAGTQVVSLFATVTDAQKRLVPDLQQSDFEVLDNDKLQ